MDAGHAHRSPTGATLRGAVSDREVTIDLRDVRLEEALDRLLGKDNFALVYASDGHVRTIELLAEGQRMSTWPPLAAGGTGTPPGVSPERQQEVMVHQLPIDCVIWKEFRISFSLIA